MSSLRWFFWWQHSGHIGRHTAGRALQNVLGWSLLKLVGIEESGHV